MRYGSYYLKLLTFADLSGRLCGLLRAPLRKASPLFALGNYWQWRDTKQRPSLAHLRELVFGSNGLPRLFFHMGRNSADGAETGFRKRAIEGRCLVLDHSQ